MDKENENPNLTAAEKMYQSHLKNVANYQKRTHKKSRKNRQDI